MNLNRAAQTNDRPRYDRGMVIIKVALGVVLAIVIMAAIIGIGSKAMEDDQKRIEAIGSSASNTSAPSETVVDVSAAQLFADYDANEVSADAKYRGRILRVSGRVQSINKGITDRPFVVLSTANEFMGVHANFAQDGTLGTLKRGQKITVRCRGQAMVMGSPMLGACVLE